MVFIKFHLKLDFKGIIVPLWTLFELGCFLHATESCLLKVIKVGKESSITILH